MQSRAGEHKGTASVGELPNGALALVEASKRLLIEGGFDALRIGKITTAAGQNRAMVNYYFGSKAAMIAVVVDSLIHEAVEELGRQAERLPEGDTRIDAHVESTIALMQTPEFLATLDVVPPALRNEDLRRRLAKLYTWYREVNAKCLDPEATEGQRRRIEGLATLFVALFDGLAIQWALDPESIDLKSLAALIKELVGSALRRDTEVTPGAAAGT